MWESIRNAFMYVLRWLSMFGSAIFGTPAGSQHSWSGQLSTLTILIFIPVAILIIIKVLAYIRSIGRF